MATKKKRKSKFIISATAMNRFWQCPYMYLLSRKMRPISVPSWVVDGDKIHKALAGFIEPKELSYQQEKAYSGMKTFEKEMGYAIKDRELKQYFEITPEIDGVRVLDGVGELRGEPVLIDYKFPVKSSQWEHKFGVASKARGFQAYLYLFEPYEYVGDWPTRIDFLVHPSSIYPVLYEDDKIAETIESAEIIYEADRANRFPRVEGAVCNFCDYFHACHEIRGWETRYDIKEDTV
jgi:CRISPR/Cas system-associated exonuclease Cas4 (RecB family)